MEKKIRLYITPAVEKYAALHGAMRDENGWYCHEPIPIKLEELIDESEKIKKQPVEKYVQCPKCGGQMKLKPTRDGGVFWGCLSYPRCRGNRNVDDVDDEIFKQVLTNHGQGNESVIENTQRNFNELAELGIKQLGSLEAILKWLQTPKVALEGKMPIQVLQHDEGYNKVMSLLWGINT